jgi:septum formation protein
MRQERVLLVLASASPTRLRVLRDAGFDPLVAASGVDENVDCPDTVSTVSLLARRKALAVSDRFERALVVGCDTMLDFEGRALGKPAGAAAAATLCRTLSGNEALLHSGHFVLDTRTGLSAEGVARTKVRFAVMTDEEIAAYVATGEPLAMAGGFSIDGYGAPFVEGIEGDHTNVLGISLPTLRGLLASLDVAIVDLWRPAL